MVDQTELTILTFDFCCTCALEGKIEVYTVKKRHGLDASGGFYRPDAILPTSCTQQSLLTSSSCIKFVNIMQTYCCNLIFADLLQVVEKNLHQTCMQFETCSKSRALASATYDSEE